MDLAGNFTTSIGSTPHLSVPPLAETQRVKPLGSSEASVVTATDRPAGVIFEPQEVETTPSTYAIGAFPRATESSAFAPITAIERVSLADARERAGAIHDLVAEFVNGAAAFGASKD